ncbi:flagellar L-ring protein [Geobacter metallireducens RCH3]|uniref:Flagellar L-ring protein n=1 Tax=Geobacter metallireducens (strain ATCC 53774 / DSM 7210 / GS-15) TaxID=269799 RepID=FLGH_GEOMG|nr:flagellar basal body L-ring protein FlgH [Geobacter metallireducens]Q39YJ8.1 RecName: Full=Flagellar L-ring protein; AltName: Full=Basal body L-ring protein; Flags: Precursor [Geobacter metallireducens GS-15]ABB30676.1 flagellar L-ring lipoprotein FlgH [Geobacter metallireducens GS-15]EHP88063.1 flagellar L-ring protein [Geobacter metallireducens RCH3]
MKRLAVSILCLALAGCAIEKAEVRTPSFDEQLPAPQPSYASGSIWQAASAGIAEDHKARRKGDIITVVIVENASASKQATTDTDRKASISASIPYLMGLEKQKLILGKLTGADLGNLLGASTDSTFGGSGATTRKENLVATMSAKIIDVLPNGNFLIEGRRNVKVNNEDQIIILQGTVRPRDVSPDNTVNSSLIADARITYTGEGVISDRQRPGWLMNFLDYIWPF